jgi:hypothetical protein
LADSVVNNNVYNSLKTSSNPYSYLEKIGWVRPYYAEKWSTYPSYYYIPTRFELNGQLDEVKAGIRQFANDSGKIVEITTNEHTRLI